MPCPLARVEPTETELYDRVEYDMDESGTQDK